MARLFNRNIAPACKYCVYGKDCVGIEKTLCEKKGVVEPENRCVAFKYNPLRRKPQRIVSKEEFKQSDFSL